MRAMPRCTIRVGVSCTGSNQANSGVRPVLAKKIVPAKKSQTDHSRRRREMARTTRKGTRRRRKLPAKLQENGNVYYIQESQIVDSYASYGNTCAAERAKNSHTM